MIDLYSPRGEMELLILRSILEDAGIPLFVRNDTFGSLYPGRYSEAYNRKTLCVPEAAAHEARILVREYLRRTGPATASGDADGTAPGGSVDPDPPDTEGSVQRFSFLRASLRHILAPTLRRMPVLRNLPALERLASPSPEERRRRFRLIRNDRPTGRRRPSDAGRPPLRIV